MSAPHITDDRPAQLPQHGLDPDGVQPDGLQPDGLHADRARRLEAAVARAISELERLVSAGGPEARTETAVRPVPLPERLVGRRRQVAEMAVQGLPTVAIAAQLGLSPNTVRNHLKGACRCLGVRTRTELIARYTA